MDDPRDRRRPREIRVLGRTVTLTLQSDERRARIGLGLALIAGGVAHYPSLHAGPVIDDHFHAAWLEGSAAVHRPAWDLYRWVSAGEVERLVGAGHVPWWSDPRLRIGVFRPISSVSRWLDHAALHDNNFLAHLHSALWWSILLVLFWWGLRGSVSGMRRGVATVLISLSPTLLVPIRWLADRNALIAFVFLTAAWGVSTQRPDGHRSLATVAALAALAALGGEIAWSALPALAALHALRFHDARRTARFVSAAAAGLTSVLLISRALGYGIHHSGIYLDPFTQPGEFLRQLPLRMLLMLSRLPASALGALFPNAGAMAEFLALPIYLLAVAAPLALLPGRRTRGLLRLAVACPPGGTLASFALRAPPRARHARPLATTTSGLASSPSSRWGAARASPSGICTGDATRDLATADAASTGHLAGIVGGRRRCPSAPCVDLEFRGLSASRRHPPHRALSRRVAGRMFRASTGAAHQRQRTHTLSPKHDTVAAPSGSLPESARAAS